MGRQIAKRFLRARLINLAFPAVSDVALGDHIKIIFIYIVVGYEFTESMTMFEHTMIVYCIIINPCHLRLKAT